MDEFKTYVALYRAAAVRDVQLCKGDVYGPDVALDEESWEDCQEAEVFVGIFTGNYESILKQVAAQEGCQEDAIRLQEVPSTTENGARSIEGAVYRVRTHCTPRTWLVETNNNDTMQALCKFCAKLSAKGYVISSVTEITDNGTTPRVSVLQQPAYKAALKDELSKKASEN